VWSLKIKTESVKLAPLIGLGAVAKRLGHNLLALVEQDESILISNGLISDRIFYDRNLVNRTNARLTDLGIKFSEHLIKYGGELP
jgi:hypothetical protein